MIDIDELVEPLKTHRRFEAALRFATTLYVERAGGDMDYPTFSEAVELADELLDELALSE